MALSVSLSKKSEKMVDTSAEYFDSLCAAAKYGDDDDLEQLLKRYSVTAHYSMRDEQGTFLDSSSSFFTVYINFSNVDLLLQAMHLFIMQRNSAELIVSSSFSRKMPIL